VPKDDFVEVATLRDPDGLGLVAPVTMRVKENGYTSFSFALFKEFEKNGETQRTAFLNDRHLPAARRLLDEIESRIALESDKLWATRRMRK
jgi:hypothetical protein